MANTDIVIAEKNFSPSTSQGVIVLSDDAYAIISAIKELNLNIKRFSS